MIAKNPNSHLLIIALFAVTVVVCTTIASCNKHDEDEDIPPGNDDDTNDTAEESEGDEQCLDTDGDRWCSPEDCADNNPIVNPGMIEDCFDGFDNDCNYLTDNEDPACEEISETTTKSVFPSI